MTLVKVVNDNATKALDMDVILATRIDKYSGLGAGLRPRQGLMKFYNGGR